MRQILTALLHEPHQSGNLLKLLATGKMVLLVQDTENKNRVTNFCQIEYIPIMWKLLTWMIEEELYK